MRPGCDLRGAEGGRKVQRGQQPFAQHGKPALHIRCHADIRQAAQKRLQQGKQERDNGDADNARSPVFAGMDGKHEQAVAMIAD